MYCSHCGKKVGDTMLFCPFCGEAIVIPEQDEVKTSAPVPESVSVPETAPAEMVETEASEPAPSETVAEPAPKSDAGEDDATAELLNWSWEREEHSDDEWARQEPVEAFSPLKLDEDEGESVDWREEISQRKQAATPEKHPPKTSREGDAPIRLEGSAPKLDLKADDEGPKDEKKPARKRANTLVPPKTMDLNDIFMDGKDNGYDDDYDPYDDDADDGYAEPFIYEDEEEGSFFMRHLRGIVGLALFAILILMFVIYAFSKAGQLTLAKVNLAWSTEAYSTLGYQNYQDGQYVQAGQFYERALQRDSDNYSYASSAAMAYFEAGEKEKSTEMLKRCVEIDPTKLEPYVYLLKLYPEAASRPWEVTQLLQQGYQRTGDSRLNVTG